MSSASNKGRRPVPGLRALGRAGVTSLEWALIAVTFLFMTISVVDIAWFLVVSQTLTTVMVDAGRQAVVNWQQEPDCGTPWAHVSEVTPLLDPAGIYICVTRPGILPGTSADPVQVQDTNVIQVYVSYPYTALIPWLSSVLNSTCVVPDGVTLPDGASTTNTICQSATYVY